MNQSNSETLTKNLAVVKHSKYYQIRKQSGSKDHNQDNFQSFAKQAVPILQKAKNVGKIRKNSTTYNYNIAQGQSILKENAKASSVMNNWIKEDLISKIRCSQILIKPEKISFQALKQTNFNAFHSKTANRNTRSVSSHYETQYTNMVQQYQKKKAKINHQIQSLRKSQSIKEEKIGKLYQTCSINLVHNMQTPKFGNNFSQSQKKLNAKPTLKAGKDAKYSAFLSAIKSQIQFDSTLRNLKHQIPRQSKEAIISILKNKYAIEEDITTIDNDEFDPFSQISQSKIQILASQLANSHLASCQHWNRHLKNNFDQPMLNELFTALESGPDKGIISLKGFVREIGVLLQNQKYLRNRDLYKIYKRIQPFHRENFINSLKVLTDI